jgi:molybdopterin converting factor small subunit
MKIECEIIFFGMIAEKMGKSEDKIEIETGINDNLVEYFKNKYPNLAHLPFQVAINMEVMQHFPSTNFTSIAILPPFAGG